MHNSSHKNGILFTTLHVIAVVQGSVMLGVILGASVSTIKLPLDQAKGHRQVNYGS
jgi:hypothetical protein